MAAGYDVIIYGYILCSALHGLQRVIYFPLHQKAGTNLFCAGSGDDSGEVMIALALLFIFSVLVAIGTVGMTKATGEILPRFGGDNVQDSHEGQSFMQGIRSALVPAHRRKQFLALIITDKAQPVSDRIISDLKRGVTAVNGKGMYTGADRMVLMCAITVTEIHNLKSAVAKEDPAAFVIVSPAHEILGRGFNPLAEKK